MERPSLIVLVRHGESERNLAKKGSIYFIDDEARKAVQGVPDHKVSLTEHGRWQAEKTGVGLKKEFGLFDYIYHSGYERTIQTVDGILKAYPDSEGTKVRSNLFIRERDSGHAFDMTTAEAEESFPWLEDYWSTYSSFFAYPPGGESIANVCERVYLFVNMLFRDRRGQKILVVTHGGTIRAFRFLLERISYDEVGRIYSPKNCSLTIYKYNGSQERLVLEEYDRVYW
ncbi:histidine phosphatase family protein [Patescibacteria group bacterium]